VKISDLYISGAETFFSIANLSKRRNIKDIATILAAIDLSLEHFLRVAKKLFARSGPLESMYCVNWNQTSAKKVNEGILSSTDKFY
jgi:hypothetical protein